MLQLVFSFGAKPSMYPTYVVFLVLEGCLRSCDNFALLCRYGEGTVHGDFEGKRRNEMHVDGALDFAVASCVGFASLKSCVGWRSIVSVCVYLCCCGRVRRDDPSKGRSKLCGSCERLVSV